MFTIKGNSVNIYELEEAISNGNLNPINKISSIEQNRALFSLKYVLKGLCKKFKNSEQYALFVDRPNEYDRELDISGILFLAVTGCKRINEFSLAELEEFLKKSIENSREPLIKFYNNRVPKLPSTNEVHNFFLDKFKRELFEYFKMSIAKFSNINIDHFYEFQALAFVVKHTAKASQFNDKIHFPQFPAWFNFWNGAILKCENHVEKVVFNDFSYTKNLFLLQGRNTNEFNFLNEECPNFDDVLSGIKICQEKILNSIEYDLSLLNANLNLHQRPLLNLLIDMAEFNWKINSFFSSCSSSFELFEIENNADMCTFTKFCINYESDLMSTNGFKTTQIINSTKKKKTNLSTTNYSEFFMSYANKANFVYNKYEVYISNMLADIVQIFTDHEKSIKNIVNESFSSYNNEIIAFSEYFVDILNSLEALNKQVETKLSSLKNTFSCNIHNFCHDMSSKVPVSILDLKNLAKNSPSIITNFASCIEADHEIIIDLIKKGLSSICTQYDLNNYQEELISIFYETTIWNEAKEYANCVNRIRQNTYILDCVPAGLRITDLIGHLHNTIALGLNDLAHVLKNVLPSTPEVNTEHHSTTLPPKSSFPSLTHLEPHPLTVSNDINSKVNKCADNSDYKDVNRDYKETDTGVSEKSLFYKKAGNDINENPTMILGVENRKELLEVKDTKTQKLLEVENTKTQKLLELGDTETQDLLELEDTKRISEVDSNMKKSKQPGEKKVKSGYPKKISLVIDDFVEPSKLTPLPVFSETNETGCSDRSTSEHSLKKKDGDFIKSSDPKQITPKSNGADLYFSQKTEPNPLNFHTPRSMDPPIVEQNSRNLSNAKISASKLNDSSFSADFAPRYDTERSNGNISKPSLSPKKDSETISHNLDRPVYPTNNSEKSYSGNTRKCSFIKLTISTFNGPHATTNIDPKLIESVPNLDNYIRNIASFNERTKEKPDSFKFQANFNNGSIPLKPTKQLSPNPLDQLECKQSTSPNERVTSPNERATAPSAKCDKCIKLSQHLRSMTKKIQELTAKNVELETNIILLELQQKN